MDEHQSEEQKKFEEWHKNPDNWKLGVFYFNKEDKRILPPKRNKMLGWTVNFANPVSILLFALLLFGVMVIFNLLAK